MDEEPLRREIYELKAELAKHQAIYDKLDEASKKMSEVTINVAKLIAILETKQDVLEKSVDEIKHHVEKRRSEREKYEREIAHTIAQLKLEATNHLSETERNFTSQIKLHSESLKLHLEDSTKHMKADVEILKKYMYYASGIIAASIFVLSYIEAPIRKLLGG